jgi:hypothetical protein
MLGKGGCGMTYKAVLDDGSVVEVKRLGDAATASTSAGSKKEFEHHTPCSAASATAAQRQLLRPRQESASLRVHSKWQPLLPPSLSALKNFGISRFIPSNTYCLCWY